MHTGNIKSIVTAIQPLEKMATCVFLLCTYNLCSLCMLPKINTHVHGNHICPRTIFNGGTKSFPFKTFCNTNLYIWCWIVALIKQAESQGWLKPSYFLGLTLWPLPGQGECGEEGDKRDKISNKNHAGNHQYTV